MKLSASATIRLLLSWCCAIVPALSFGADGTEIAPGWNIRTELLVVQVPQGIGLSMRNRLTDDAVVDAAVNDLRQMIVAAQATLIGTVIAWTPSGERGVSETIEEIRYSTEFDPPHPPRNFGPQPSVAERIASSVRYGPQNIDVPTSFETRNAGVTLECTGTASADGRSVRLDLVAQSVRYLGDRETLVVAKDDHRFKKPLFRTSKVGVILDVRSGCWKLIGVDVIRGEMPVMEFCLIRPTAIPIGR